MQRQDVFAAVHERIERCPQWEDICHGKTWTKCREISSAVYNFLNRPENAIEGLSLAMVDGTGYQANHAWIMAYHRDAGFFLIDPTAGQFLYSSKQEFVMPYHDVFIGSYDELKKMVVDSGEYKTRSNFYSIWPPYMTMTPYYENSAPPKYFFKPEEVEPVWSRCPQKIDLEKPPDRLATGAWAAEMERHGLSWQDAIAGRYGTGTHHMPQQVTTWQIEKERDEYLAHTKKDNAQNVRNAIYDAVTQLPIGKAIAEGQAHNHCKNFCKQIYDHLMTPEHAIEGLKLAVVETDGFNADHTWLLAHHPDAGFLVIDPTVAQFAKHKDTHNSYPGPFIGSYSELETTLRNPASYAMGDEFYAIWSPAMHFYHEEAGDQRVDYYRKEDLPTWKKFEFPIGFERYSGVEREGRWAARMEEEGIDWRKAIGAHCHAPDSGVDVPEWPTSAVTAGSPSWPDRNSPEQMKRYQDICTERNRHIRLGNYSDDESYQQKLGESYRAPEGPTR